MKVLIVEDEPLAAAQLAAHLSAVKPNAQIVAVCDTVKTAVDWLKNNEAPHLAFFDIHLGDGLSFEIFEQFQQTPPVIFVTAYDQYAIKAFKVNSIDYLLKPIDRDDLQHALEKFEKRNSLHSGPMDADIVKQLVSALQKENYKERFLVKSGTHLKVAEVAEILYFYSFRKGTYARLTDGKDLLLDYSLDWIEGRVNPAIFFRINRKYLIALQCIADVVAYSNSRLKLKVQHPFDNDFLVAREKVSAFKQWLEGE